MTWISHITSDHFRSLELLRPPPRSKWFISDNSHCVRCVCGHYEDTVHWMQPKDASKFSHCESHSLIWRCQVFLQSAQRLADRPLKTTIPNFVYLQDWTSNFEIDWRALKRLHFSILFSNLYSRLNRKFRFEHQNSTTSNARSLTES